MIEVEVTGEIPEIRLNMEQALEKSGLWMLQSIQRNFEVGGRPSWPESKRLPVGGRTLIDSGALYESGEYSVSGNTTTVTWGRGIPYAGIQNYGGTVNPTITDKSKKFFWAMFYQSGEEFWKWMALKPEGEVLTVNIPARRFMMFQDEDIDKITEFFRDYAVVFEGTSESIGVSRTGSDSTI